MIELRLAEGLAERVWLDPGALRAVQDDMRLKRRTAADVLEPIVVAHNRSRKAFTIHLVHARTLVATASGQIDGELVVAEAEWSG